MTRRGISLLEVLISMFIILMGLLGVAAMLPLGKLYMADGTIADRAGAMGKAAFREIEIRGWLNTSKWSNSSQKFDVVIDPLSLANNSANTQLPRTGTGLPRITMTSIGSSIAMADSICRSQDDYVLANSTTPDYPPVQEWFGSGAKRMSSGEYSWFATVAPDPVLGNQNLVTVSVAVVHRRSFVDDRVSNYLIPPERLCNVRAMQGADILLTIPNTIGVTDDDAYLRAKPGRWLLLVDTSSGSARRAHWYRVVGTDDVADHNIGNVTVRGRYITIAGQDWNVPAATTSAILVDNVVAVYEKSMRLESSSNPWN